MATASTPSVHAAVRGHATGTIAAGIRAALAAGGDVNERDQNGRTPLFHACLYAPIVTQLLDAGADPNAVDASGENALVYTLGKADGDNRKYVASAEILLARGLDPETPDADGFTPLLSAAERGFLRHVVLLIAAGANAGARDPQGRGPLQITIESYGDEADARKTIDAIRRSPSCDPGDVAAASAAATARGWTKLAKRLV